MNVLTVQGSHLDVFQIQNQNQGCSVAKLAREQVGVCERHCHGKGMKWAIATLGVINGLPL